MLRGGAKNFGPTADPLPGGAGRQKFNQLVIDWSWLIDWLIFIKVHVTNVHAQTVMTRSQNNINTHTHTHTQTGDGHYLYLQAQFGARNFELSW